jgi:hypothetical protein
LLASVTIFPITGGPQNTFRVGFWKAEIASRKRLMGGFSELVTNFIEASSYFGCSLQNYSKNFFKLSAPIKKVLFGFLGPSDTIPLKLTWKPR